MSTTTQMPPPRAKTRELAVPGGAYSQALGQNMTQVQHEIQEKREQALEQERLARLRELARHD